MLFLLNLFKPHTETRDYKKNTRTCTFVFPLIFIRGMP